MPKKKTKTKAKKKRLKLNPKGLLKSVSKRNKKLREAAGIKRKKKKK